MANLFELIVSLVDDAGSRTRFRADPETAVEGIDDLTGEDVAAAANLARVQIAPEYAAALTTAMDLRAGGGETHRGVALRALAAICDALDQADG